MRTLDPPSQWTPDTEAALAQFRSQRTTRYSWRWGAIAAGVAVAALLAWPEGRATAQRLWNIVMLGRADIVRVDWDRIPDGLALPSVVGPKGQVEKAASREAATQKAGFDVRLPRHGIISGDPAFTVVGPLAVELQLRKADLAAALESARITDLSVPSVWDGTKITMHSGPLVQADYQDVSIVQTRPISVVTAPGVLLSDVVEVALRLAGVNRAEAHRLAARMAESPGLLLGVTSEDAVTIREVALRDGVGTLLHDLDEGGRSERLTLLWSTNDRLYILSGSISDDLAVQVANAMQ